MNSAPEIYEAILQTYKDKKRAVLAMMTEANGSVPQKTGSMMLLQKDQVTGTIGGGKIEFEVTKEMQGLLGKYFSPYKKRFHLTKENFGMQCGGNAEIFFQPVGAWFTCHIFGAGHICQELQPILKKMDFTLNIYDNREQYARERSFPVEVIDYNKISQKMNIQPLDCVVIITHSHAHDEICLKNCLQFSPAYLGMIGSKNKVKEIFQRLEKEGYPAEKLNKVDSPIGIPLPSRTPIEVAISIAARLIEIKDNMQKEPLS